MKVPQWLIYYSWRSDHLPMGYPSGGRVVHIWKGLMSGRSAGNTVCGKYMVLSRRLFELNDSMCPACLRWAEKNIDIISEEVKDEKV